MNNYELMVIFTPVLSDDEFKSQQKKYAKMVTEAGGTFHFVMGPAGTFYNQAWTKKGDYKFSARVTQQKAPSHPTSYGIAFGGANLADPNQTYTYFLVRQAGEFFISNREGATKHLAAGAKRVVITAPAVRSG